MQKAELCKPCGILNTDTVPQYPVGKLYDVGGGPFASQHLPQHGRAYRSGGFTLVGSFFGCPKSTAASSSLGMGLGRPALVLVVAATRGHALCWTAEQPNCDYALATLATKPTLRELELFLRTLHRFDATRKVYVGTDSSRATGRDNSKFTRSSTRRASPVTKHSAATG